MSDNQPVPYPSLGAAYPVSNASYPVAPPVPAFKPAEVAEQAVKVVAAQEPATPQVAAEETYSESAAPKFFPLVPTPTSKFVAPDEIPVEEQTWAPFNSVEEEVQLEATDTQATEAENLFEISSSLTHEPQTNSIVLDSIPDVLTSSETFSDAGEILVTGSIELPTITGEISLANESPEADSADALDSASVTISTVAPVRAPSVINSKAQLGVLPSKRRRSQGQLMAMLTLGLLIITVGTLYVMASILGIIK